MKLLVVSHYDRVVPTRPEAEIFLSLHRQGGFEIDVVTSAGSAYGRRFRDAGLRVVDHRVSRRFSPGSFRLLRRELVRGRHDVAFLFNNGAIANGVWAAMGLPVKVVAYRGYTGNVHLLDPTAWLKLLHPRVDRILCNNASVLESLPGPARRKAVVIYKGHDVAWYAGVERADLAAFGVPEGAFTVSCVANVRPMKGLEHLLRATHLLPADPPVHLLLVGKKMDAPDLLRLVETSPMRDRIHHVGFRDDPLDVVAASDAFALPSVKGEGMSKAVIEAMCLGVAPVVTDIPGSGGLVVDGRSGCVVPPGDAAALARAIAGLASDRERCRRLGAGAREHVRSALSHDATVARVRALLDDLARDRRTAPAGLPPSG